MATFVSPALHKATRRLSLLLVLGLAELLSGGVPAKPEPIGRPTASYAEVLAKLAPATGVMIDFYGGAKVVVANAGWIAQLQQILRTAATKPDVDCFCYNYPRLQFFSKEGILGQLEVAHGKKLRMHAGTAGGDYAVDPSVAQAVVDLLMAQKANASPPPQPPSKPIPPPKIDINLKP